MEPLEVDTNWGNTENGRVEAERGGRAVEKEQPRRYYTSALGAQCTFPHSEALGGSCMGTV